MVYKEYVPYTQKVEITEKRAPTDDSIRLYKELEQKAENSIINKETFNDNNLNGVIIYKEMGSYIDKVKAHIRFSINAKEHHLSIEVPRTSIFQREETARLLYTAIIEELAKQFTIELYKI